MRGGITFRMDVAYVVLYIHSSGKMWKTISGVRNRRPEADSTTTKLLHLAET